MIASLLCLTLLLPVQKPVSNSPRPTLAAANTEDVLATDARLHQKVTVERPSATLNEVLASISEQTGVTLKMRDAKVLGEQKVCICAKDTEAQKLLTGLAALFHFKHSTCEWEPLIDGTGFALRTGGHRLSGASEASQARGTT